MIEKSNDQSNKIKSDETLEPAIQIADTVDYFKVMKNDVIKENTSKKLDKRKFYNLKMILFVFVLLIITGYVLMTLFQKKKIPKELKDYRSDNSSDDSSDDSLEKSSDNSSRKTLDNQSENPSNNPSENPS